MWCYAKQHNKRMNRRSNASVGSITDDELNPTPLGLLTASILKYEYSVEASCYCSKQVDDIDITAA